MTNFQKRIASAVAAGSLLLQLATPAFAQVNIEISGNGSGSDNDANVDVNTTTRVLQNNFASIDNDVDAKANTGKNDANDNTGGDVDVDTGNATTVVGISNDVNHNSAEVDCCVAGADVLISGNGSESNNTADLDMDSKTTVVQLNTAYLDNDVDAKANTGKNDANDNTGGNVDVDTGNAATGVSISNSGNSNAARVSGDPGTVSLRILGNGSGSDNDIDLNLTKSLVLTQNNLASLRNHVHASANTGENDANDNTGGNVDVDTGDATTLVDIDNMVNFNWADLDCGCILDVFAKIAGNGSDSDNTIDAELVDLQLVTQLNTWLCGGYYDPIGDHGIYGEDCNDVDAKSNTGKNDAEDNTGDPDGDPSIDTGDALTEVVIGNEGNVNVVGDGPDFELPDLPDFPDLDGIDFGFNLSFFWLWFSGLLG